MILANCCAGRLNYYGPTNRVPAAGVSYLETMGIFDVAMAAAATCGRAKVRLHREGQLNDSEVATIKIHHDGGQA